MKKFLVIFVIILTYPVILSGRDSDNCCTKYTACRDACEMSDDDCKLKCLREHQKCEQLR